MSDGAPASLTSSLLARKGFARPAALPEDNYSPFRNEADAWRHTVRPAANETSDDVATAVSDYIGPPDMRPNLGEADTKAGHDGAECPEAALTQIRVQRSEWPKSVPVESGDGIESEPYTIALEPSDPPSATPVSPEDVTPSAEIIEPAGPSETTADTVAPEETAQPAPPVALPPEIADAAMRPPSPGWRRHMMTFALSFLVGGALAFVGWSIYSKGGFRTDGPTGIASPTTGSASPQTATASAATPEGGSVAPNAVTATTPNPEAPVTTIPAVAGKPAPAEIGPKVLSVRFAEDGRATIVGTAPAGSDVVLLDNGSLLATVTADRDGIWTYIGDAALANGSHDFAAAAVTSTAAARVPAPEPAKFGTTEATAGERPASPTPAAASEALPQPLPPPAETGQETGLDPAQVPLPSEKRERTSAVAPESRYVVQLASLPSEADALRFWQSLEKRSPDLTGRHQLLVQTGSLPQGQTVFRVRAGPFSSRQAAQRACRGFRAVTGDCLVVRRPARES